VKMPALGAETLSKAPEKNKCEVSKTKKNEM
jgi:hypothetical protein